MHRHRHFHHHHGHGPRRPSPLEVEQLADFDATIAEFPEEEKRGKRRAPHRLRVGDYRVFYDVLENVVSVVAVLHTDDTPRFCERGEEP